MAFLILRQQLENQELAEAEVLVYTNLWFPSSVGSAGKCIGTAGLLTVITIFPKFLLLPKGVTAKLAFPLEPVPQSRYHREAAVGVITGAFPLQGQWWAGPGLCHLWHFGANRRIQTPLFPLCLRNTQECYPLHLAWGQGQSSPCPAQSSFDFIPAEPLAEIVGEHHP